MWCRLQYIVAIKVPHFQFLDFTFKIHPISAFFFSTTTLLFFFFLCDLSFIFSFNHSCYLNSEYYVVIFGKFRNKIDKSGIYFHKIWGPFLYFQDISLSGLLINKISQLLAAFTNASHLISSFLTALLLLFSPMPNKLFGSSFIRFCTDTIINHIILKNVKKFQNSFRRPVMTTVFSIGTTIAFLVGYWSNIIDECIQEIVALE